MKKLFTVLVALTFALGLAAVSLAETKAAPSKPTEPVEKVEAKKEKSHQITGIVEAVDDAAGTLTVKGNKESIGLKVKDEVSLEKIHLGDKVLVNYTGDTASSVKKVAGKKEMAPAPPAGK
jgi:Cu/Ag efflux protein CusF